MTISQTQPTSQRSVQQTFHIYGEPWNNNMRDDKATPAYYVQVHSGFRSVFGSKPDMTIFRGSKGSADVVATGRIHTSHVGNGGMKTSD